MKAKYLLGAAVALAGLIPLCGLSQDAAGVEKKKKGPPENAVVGVVKSVDATAKTVTVDERKTNESKTFTVGEKTKIKIDGQDKTLADLAAGQRVILVPNKKKGDLANSINVRTAAAKGKGGKKKAQ